MTTLFDTERHEPLQAPAWDERAARTWIARFVDDAQRAFTPEGLCDGRLPTLDAWP